MNVTIADGIARQHTDALLADAAAARRVRRARRSGRTRPAAVTPSDNEAAERSSTPRESRLGTAVAHAFARPFTAAHHWLAAGTCKPREPAVPTMRSSLVHHVISHEDEQIGRPIDQLLAADPQITAHPRRQRLGQTAEQVRGGELTPRPDPQRGLRPVELLRLGDDQRDEAASHVRPARVQRRRGQRLDEDDPRLARVIGQ